MSIYDDVVEKLASGNVKGLNTHRLTNGYFAADLPGTGKGRGAGRVIYEIVNGVVEIVDITLTHYK